MTKKGLFAITILAVVLIVLGSLSNVVGYEAVRTSQQNLIKERVNQKDLLFQTICDLANNKEIQKAILESQCKFQNPFPTTQQITFPTITKKQLNLMYFLGLVLFKIMGKARMESLVKAHPINAQANEKINSIIINNTELKEEMAQLSILNCPSCSEAKGNWSFPFIFTMICCDLLLIFGVLIYITLICIIGFYFQPYFIGYLLEIDGALLYHFGCIHSLNSNVKSDPRGAD